MKKQNPILNDNEITMKLITKNDLDSYYTASFEHVDPMVNYYTGTTTKFNKEIITSYVNRIIDDESRYDFLIRNTQDDILGEIVLNEIEWESKLASFRIALFHTQYCDKGIGKRSIDLLLAFAFETLHLHRIELEVFDFNERALHVYESCGFQIEGKKRDGLFLNNTYHAVYIMGILQEDYSNLASTRNTNHNM